MSGRLVLFDIDGTLIDAGGAGMAALRQAALELYGDEGPALDLAGSTDSGILRQIFASMDIEYTDGRAGEFYDRYLVHLEANTAGDGFPGRLLPGVGRLLELLDLTEATLGLLTGNIARGAAIKTRHFQLDGFFGFGAYGDDHHDRNKLGEIALSRAAAVTGRRFSGRDTVVVGDTPKDIACGRAIGAVTICVATGSFSQNELRAHGADVVLDDFRDPPALVEQISAEKGG
jgi:phosphoglycolate phosphatase-like HAD superfamily hydrolase